MPDATMEPLRSEKAVSQEHCIRRKPVASHGENVYHSIPSSAHESEQTLRNEDPRDEHVNYVTSVAELDTDSPSHEVSNRQSERSKPQVWKQARLWLPEALWCLFSIVLFGVIVAVLAWRNNKPLPKWYADLTVNTVIALLATVCRAATVVPVSEGISQLKWNWLAQRGRPLRDLMVFDQASRGPWGSLRMVLTARGQIFALVAALVLTTGLATSTFTQSAIILETRQVRVENGTARMNMSSSTPRDVESLRFAPRSAFEGDLKRTVWQAALGPPDRLSSLPSEPTCSTSECRWDRYSSLGVCVSLHNATESLQIEHGEEKYGWIARLSNDTYMKVERMDIPDYDNGGDIMSNISSPATAKTITFQNHKDVLNASIWSLSFIILETDSPADPDFHAFELIWYYCVQTLDLKVSEGKTYVKAVSHTEVVDSGGEAASWDEDTRFITLTSAEKRENFTVWRNNTEIRGSFIDRNGGFPEQLEQTLSSFVTQRLSFGVREYVADRPFEQLPNDTGQRIWTNLDIMGKSVAVGLSNLLLEYGAPVHGTALAPVVFIRVNWAWLTFLAAQIFLSCVFLIAVIVQTANLGVEVVKSSVIATLLALDREGEPVAFGLRRDVDKKVIGSLENREDTWRVVLHKKEEKA